MPPLLAARGLPLASIVWLLGLTQIIGYGTLYYSFAILAPDIAAEFGLQLSTVYGGFSLALLAGGIAAPRAGRWIDRQGAAKVMALGSVVAAVALAVMALAPNPAVLMGGLLIGEVAGALILYDAAFALVVQVSGGDARRRITHLTLVAGFSSSLFWPLTSALGSVFDWREVLGLFAVMNLAVCLPAHLWLVRMSRFGSRAAPAAGMVEPDLHETPLPEAQRRRAFVLVTLGFSLGGFLLSAILAQMVPMLTALGVGSASVAVAALFGPAQVLVRFVNMTLGSGRHPLTITIVASALLPAGVLVLALTAPALAGAVAFILLFGFGSGLNSIVRGTLPLALFGRAAYGERLGRMAFVRTGLTSVSPFVMAFLTDTSGTPAALLVMAATGLAGLAMFIAVARLRNA
jgi:MFS family permease